jgi:lipopolysaccharide export system permease protein
MNRTKEYILLNFSHTFLQIFFVVFLLAIIISFIEIVSRTYVAQVDFISLILLLVYKIPDIMVYLIPLIYFVAFVMSIRQLSLDSEMVVLFSIGLSPTNLAKIIFANSLLISFVLFILAFMVIPVTTQAYKLLVQDIKTNTGLKNLNQAGFIQKFDNWHIFVGNEKKDRNIVLFSNSFQNQSSFILAKEATYESLNGNIKLKLERGKIFTKQEDTLDQINFYEMSINKKNRQNIFGYLELHLYWLKVIAEKKYDLLIMPIFIVLFPMLSVLSILYLGITEHRHPSKYIILISIAHIVIYFLLAFDINNRLNINGLLFMPAIWIVITSAIFFQKVVRKF